MILTDYYKFKRTATKSRTRMDCTASTQSYPELEERRATAAQKATPRRDAIEEGALIAHYVDVPKSFRGDTNRRAGKALTIKGRNVTSIYVADPESGFAYGDFKGTDDALLFVFKDLNTINGIIQAGGVIEVFVARGQSKNRVPLYNLLSDGELDGELDALRARATPDPKTVEADSLY